MTTSPQRLSDLDERLVRSMSPNDLAIHIGALVKAGKLDQTIAMDRFGEMSQSLPTFQAPVMSPDDLTDLSYRVQLKNVQHKYTLKFDLKTKGINLYYRGKCKQKIRYDEDVKSFEADEDNTFILKTTSLDLMEFEAEGLEEKNAILDVLERFEQDRRSAEAVDVSEESKKSEDQNEEAEKVSDLPAGERKPRRSRPNLMESLRVPVFKQILKEGDLEKQGHGKGAFSWPIRYVEIKPGQLAYYKPGNKKQPLNILTLDQSVAIDYTPEGFEIKLPPKRGEATNDRRYNFRVSKGAGDLEKELDEWFQAIQLAIQGTNEKEIMMSICATQGAAAPTRTIMALRQIGEGGKQARKKSFSFQKSNKKYRNLIGSTAEPAPHVDFEEPNIAKLLCQLKQQINFLLLLSEELKNDRVKNVSENLSEICKFMEDQVRRNPDNTLPFQPLNRIGSISTDIPVSTDMENLLEDTLTHSIVPENEFPDSGSEDLQDHDQAFTTVTAETTIADFKRELSTIQSIDENILTGPEDTNQRSLSPKKILSPTHSVPADPVPVEEPTDPVLLSKIPDPPPNMQEAINFFLLIENVPTGDPRIPRCPPNMPEANKYIKKTILCIADIPPPPPNFPMVDKILGIDSFNIVSPQNPVCKVNMKPLNWNKLGMKLVKNNSMWIKPMEDIAVDMDKLEILFKEEKMCSKKKQTVKEKPKRELLLDDKRAMGIDIFLKKTRFNFEELDEILNNALESGEDTGDRIYLQLEELEDLSKYPTEQDNDLFKAVKKNPDEMEKADRFIHTVCLLQFYKERVEVILLMREIPVNYTLILQPIKVLSQACNELNNSEKFAKVLGLVLRIGNHINSGNTRGNAGGFHLSVLSKLITYKGVEPKYSLLHFIVQQIFEKNEDLLQFFDDLSTVGKGIDASVEGILAEIELMKQQLSKIRKTRESIANHEEAGKYSQFISDVDVFLESYENKHNELIAQHKDLKNAYFQVLAKYGDTDTESDEFMGYINDFVRDFKKVSAELKKQRELEKKKQDILLRSKSTSNNNVVSPMQSRKKTKHGQNFKRSSTVCTGVKSPLEETTNQKTITTMPENETENQSKGAAPIDPAKAKVCVPKYYDLQLEKKGMLRSEWKLKRFILSDKQLRWLNMKNEEEDKVYLGKQSKISFDSTDPQIIEVKTKEREKEKRLRIKCTSETQSNQVINEFKAAQNL